MDAVRRGRCFSSRVWAAALLLLSNTAWPAPQTAAEVLAASAPADWRPLTLDDTLYLDLPTGRVVIELARGFAPHHVRNIVALVRGGYFDGLTVNRVQDNYVAQWGDAAASDPDAGTSRPLPQDAQPTLPAEFERPSRGVAFTALSDKDTYAPEVGVSNGFPVARDSARGALWLAHCYGMVGAGRDNPPDSSNGSELYVVIGHSPRHLDRNITLVGRVVWGMEHFSSLPRGHGNMGFYQRADERVPITRVRLASLVPPAERLGLEVLRTDSATYRRYLQARRSRSEAWFFHPVGRLELCNLGVPVRVTAAGRQP